MVDGAGLGSVTRRGLALAPLLAVGWPAGAAPLDRSRLRLSFEENFDQLDMSDERTRRGRWRTQFGYGGLDSFTSRCNAAGEACYVDAGFTGGKVNPFAIVRDPVEGGVLELTADRTPPELLGRCFNRPYTSGVLTTKFSFWQMFGYFEARVQLPAGKGYWPAFWALPADNSWSTEIDVFEHLGDRHVLYQSMKGTVPGEQGTVPVRQQADLTSGFHDHGVWVDEQNVIWFIDGQETRRATTPAGAKKPLYWLFNMAIGGAWAGRPTAETAFPARLRVASFKAYRFT